MSSEDILEIRRLKHEYCFSIDGGDYDRWVDLFTADGRFVRDNGDTFQGPDELYSFATGDFEDAYDHSAHMITNPVIDIDGETATGTWYLFLLYRDTAGDINWTQALYHDKYRKEDGTWRIVESNVAYGIRSTD